MDKWVTWSDTLSSIYPLSQCTELLLSLIARHPETVSCTILHYERQHFRDSEFSHFFHWLSFVSGFKGEFSIKRKENSVIVYESLFSVKHNILKNVGNQIVDGSHWLPFFPSYGSRWLPSTVWLPTVFKITCFMPTRGKKLWENLHFWVNFWNGYYL